MKILKIILMPIFIMFVLNGCVINRENISFNNEYVDNESIKYISNKTKDISIGINSKEKYSIAKRPNTKWAGRGNELTVNNEFNEKVLKSVLEQYFEKINISEINNEDLFIDAKIINFEWEPIWGGQKLDYNIRTKVYKKEKLIFEKEYNKEQTYTKLIATFNSTSELANTLQSKTLFKFYNEEFIPDLAKALKENP
ncbi:hypothetical protein [Arcobacter aquimarinus]|uniref:hypothetical protein n=1 Tax=Arcobacter aquimarinus TaxID=1315211 RepID=UPI003BB2141F